MYDSDSITVDRDNVLMCIKCQMKFSKHCAHIFTVLDEGVDWTSQLRVLVVENY